MHMAKQTADLKKARDEELVVLAREENTRAFDELVNRYQNKIYRLARRMTATAPAASIRAMTLARLGTGLSSSQINDP